MLDDETRAAYEETGSASVTDAISQAQFVTGARHDSYVNAAQAAGYQPASGLSQSFEDAEVMLVDDVYYITVPMLGTNVPSRLCWNGGTGLHRLHRGSRWLRIGHRCSLRVRREHVSDGRIAE